MPGKRGISRPINAGTGSYLGGSTAPNSYRMANFATMQMMDQTSQRCASILAKYNATQDSNALAEQGLKQDTFDQSDAKNSLVAALNVLSGGHFQLQNQTKANGNVQACLAEQQTLANKVQRDQLGRRARLLLRHRHSARHGVCSVRSDSGRGLHRWHELE